ncbi:MAG TPA: tetratricopeptide repeat protein [Thermoanaerobaculia bacterium]
MLRARKLALALAAFFGAAVLRADDPILQAEKLLARKEYAAAERLLRETLEADPTSARAHGNLALALLPQRKLREAVDEGRLAAAFGPGSGEARYIYGLALKADGRPLEAAREFERAVALKPGEPAPLEALAEAYAAAEDDRAAEAYERLIGLEPERPALRISFVDYLWRAGETKRGNEAAAAALEHFPQSIELHALYGRALFDQERFVDASAELARARELGDRDAGTLSLLGNALWQSGRIDAAREILEGAVREHPQAMSLHQDLGRFLLSQGQSEAALPPLAEVARAKPRDAAAQLDLGRACEGAARLPEAEAAYRQAVSLAPQLSAPRYALGRLLVRQGRREEGQKELAVYQSLYTLAERRIFESESRRGEALLAWSELRAGKPAEALKHFESLPESADSLTGQAAALSHLKRHREAVEVLERARTLRPDSPKIQAMLAAERAHAEQRP